MISNLIIHTQHKINCEKFINKLLQQNRHFQYYNNFLIPYFCKDINHNSAVISGNFIFPMWITLEKTILLKESNFTYTYISGNDFTIECKPDTLKNYSIINKTQLFKNTILAYEKTLVPNSILLFSIPSDVAKPFIEYKLM